MSLQSLNKHIAFQKTPPALVLAFFMGCMPGMLECGRTGEIFFHSGEAALNKIAERFYE